MISIVLMILRDTVFGPWVYGLGVLLLYVAAVLTLWSMVLYMRSAWPSLSGRGMVRDQD
jgi:CDP-diacylglycerol--glycerol-3-phosphate 3-phosphatidyltransferase/cardiolipin synthase